MQEYVMEILLLLKRFNVHRAHLRESLVKGLRTTLINVLRHHLMLQIVLVVLVLDVGLLVTL